MVVTRVAGEDENASLGRDIGQQFFSHPSSLAVASLLCLCLALLPGMPRGVFLLVGGVTGWSAFFLHRRQRLRVASSCPPDPAR